MRTGCFVKMRPVNKIFNFLTVAFILFLAWENISYAQSIVLQEKALTYLRWNFFTGRDQLQFNKSGKTVVIKTLNSGLYKNLKEELEALKFDSQYVVGVNYKQSENEENNIGAASIEVELKDENVEMFSFYRERDKKYVVDFWMDGDAVSLTKLKNKKTNEKILVEEVSIPQSATVNAAKKTHLKSEKETAPDQKINKKEELFKKVKEDKELSRFIVDPDEKIVRNEADIEKNELDLKKLFRDFRYGATFIWDYDPIAPIYKELVNLKTKIPAHYYEIQNRNFKKNDKEAHLQLTINLYKKKKWGLMYKSIKLFQQKNGEDAEWEFFEFLKANALLRENIDSPSPELFKNALSILLTLVEKSENYELKKAINKYLLTYYIENKEYLKTLQLAKNYFSGTRDSFDHEESAIPAEAMLNSLAKLGQVEQIMELSKEKTIKSILSPQLIMAYQTYSYLRRGDVKSIIDLYEKNKISMGKDINAVIMYNTAEAYFRLGKYNEALQLYQDFVKNYSFEFVASNANLRIALCSDLLDRNYLETLELYKKAIDSSVDSNVSYESRIRYVAFRSVRKNLLNDEDREIRIFLENNKYSNVEPDKNLKKLLYQVRLRGLIVDGKYDDALTYLSVIPMMTMTKIDARIFDGDGAEIIFGIISDLYKKSEYSQVIKTWQLYKDKYMDKVALDPFVNFIVGSSYIKLGLYKGFDEIYNSFLNLKETPNRTFPIWIDRAGVQKTSNLLSELVLIKDINLKNWDLVQKNIINYEKNMPNYNKINYYKGLIAFNQKNYKEATSLFETFFSKEDQRIIYDPSDVADMIKAYTDSIYEQGQVDKFLKVGDAILSDTKKFGTNNAYIKNVRERIAYLGIEITVGKGATQNYLLIEKKINEFLKLNPKSIYAGRVNYILGQAMINNQKVKEGTEILKNLMNDKDTSDYIKELAKSELSLLSLKERTL